MPNLALVIQGIRGTKLKVRSQLGIVATEDGRLLLAEYDALRVCCSDTKTETAYLLDAANQVKSKSDNRWYQLFWERSSRPICPLKESPVTDLKKLINDLYKESKEACKAKKYREANTTPWATTLFRILCAGVIVGSLIKIFLGSG